jgi:hypothetical protein
MNSIRPRSGWDWLTLVVGLLASAGGLTALVVERGVLWALFTAALGMAIVVFAFRRKAPAVDGALARSSADLLLGARQFPGELSLMADRLAWTPSKYSSGCGVDEFSLPLGECSQVEISRGPGLLDVRIVLTSAAGVQTHLLTHRSRLTRRLPRDSLRR